MMEKDYINNIFDILDDGVVAKYELTKLDILRDIFKDSELSSIIYKKFVDYFNSMFDEDSLYMKCEDLVYRTDRFINEYICPKYNTLDHYKIKEVLLKMIDSVDLYGGVNYDSSDTFEELFDMTDEEMGISF